MQAVEKAEVLAPSPEASESAVSRGLGLWDAVSIIVGIVIGAGIYETAPLVLANVSSPAMALVVWGLGGALSFVGACCYAELASAYPRSGGDYVYLTRAFGRPVGFLFGWAQLAMLMTGSIGMMAYVFSDYAVAGLGLSAGWSSPLAALAVSVLTLINVASVSVGKTAQNALSALKVIGLGAVVLTAFVLSDGATPAPATAPGAGSFALAMILVLYTYGGWNDAAFVASEVRERKRNLPRALLFGTLIITLIYVLVNGAFMASLGFDAARTSRAIAADVMGGTFGSPGRVFISLLVMISALGAANALIFTGSRVHATLGADYSSLAALGRWQPRLGSPVSALFVQLAVTLLLIGAVGTSAGRSVIDSLLTSAGLPAATWAGHGGFDTLLRCSAPVFWAFFLLSALSLIVLRFREPEHARPFRVPLYPLLPLVFAGTCAYMLYSAVDYAGGLTLVGVLPVLLGIPLYFVSRRRPARITARERAASDPVV